MCVLCDSASGVEDGTGGGLGVKSWAPPVSPTQGHYVINELCLCEDVNNVQCAEGGEETGDNSTVRSFVICAAHHEERGLETTAQ